MKDATGREIKIGDFVLYLEGIGGRTNCSFHPAMVVKINRKSLRVVKIKNHRHLYFTYTKDDESNVEHERMQRSESQLYIIDEIPKTSGEFQKEMAYIIQYCLEHEELPDSARENCIYQMGTL